MNKAIIGTAAILSLAVLLAGVAIAVAPLFTVKLHDLIWFDAPMRIVLVQAVIIFVWLLLVVLPIRYR